MTTAGDFYDVLPLDDTTVAAVIGDVEGHGVTAAALMGQVRLAVHAHATAGAAPDKVLTRTNRLLADLDSELLVSCFYAHIGLARHEVTLTSAGHVPPLLRRAPGRADVVRLDPGPLLGIGTGGHYPVTTVGLPPGAVLALYTDGLLEAPGTDTTHATERLAERLAAGADLDLHRLIDRLLHPAERTGQSADDITVLLLRATEQGEGPDEGRSDAPDADGTEAKSRPPDGTP